MQIDQNSFTTFGFLGYYSPQLNLPLSYGLKMMMPLDNCLVHHFGYRQSIESKESANPVGLEGMLDWVCEKDMSLNVEEVPSLACHLRRA